MIGANIIKKYSSSLKKLVFPVLKLARVLNEYDIRVCWELNMMCNFRCPYCFQLLEHRKNPSMMDQKDTKKAIDFFMNLDKKCLIIMSGGEPFLYPNFIDLCKKISKKHYIRIATNLSSPLVYEFAKKMDPKKISIHVTLHITEIERLNLKKEIIKKIKILKEKGFTVYAFAVMWPPILERFEDIYSEFKKHEIIIKQLNFVGYYNQKLYPGAYTEEETKKMIYFENLFGKDNNDKNIEPIQKVTPLKRTPEEMFKGQLSFKGLPCLAGKNFLWIRYNGDVKRCSDTPLELGNIYKNNVKLLDKPLICDGGVCSCKANGLEYALGKPRIITSKEERPLENLG